MSQQMSDYDELGRRLIAIQRPSYTVREFAAARPHEPEPREDRRADMISKDRFDRALFLIEMLIEHISSGFQDTCVEEAKRFVEENSG